MHPLKTPDGRYIVVKGRLWRASNPNLPEHQRVQLTRQLMSARRNVQQAQKSGDDRQLIQARTEVNKAKVALGERGAVWWSDGAPDYNQFLVKNTPYAEWYNQAATV